MNYISDMMCDSKKLFLSKTRTALENLERNIDEPGTNSDFKRLIVMQNHVQFYLRLMLIQF